MLIQSPEIARKQVQKKSSTIATTLGKLSRMAIGADSKKKGVKREEIEFVLELMETEGVPFIQACQQCGKAPARVLRALDKIENIDLQQRYYSARVLLAEWYLNRREILEKQLLNGDIDVATYQALAGDYMKLAAKLAPLAYGDKIAFEVNNNNVKLSVDSEAIQRLNALINSAAPQIENQPLTETQNAACETIPAGI